jgi:hypothetical protein
VERLFTPEEANAALVEVRPLVEQLVSHRRKLSEAQALQTALITRIAGNGGDMAPSDLREAQEAIERAAGEIAEAAEKLTELGVQIKSLEEGLVDFPALRNGEVVLLCWKLGEREILYWHGADEGFAGRKPLPL